MGECGHVRRIELGNETRDMSGSMTKESSFEATVGEIRTLASTLEAIHGVHAAEVADFYADAHGQEGDRGRLRALSTVAGLIRRREIERLEQFA